MWRRIPGGRRGLALAALVAVLVLAAVWPGRVAVELGSVERGPLEATVDEEGETRVRERFVISAPVAGRVQRIDLEPGDPVVCGETLLATIRPASPTPLDARSRAEAQAALRAADAALGRARAERERARADLDYAAGERDRQQALAEQQIASGEQLQAAETSARAAEEGMRAADFAVASAGHEREMAAARLRASDAGGGDPIRILSPIDGAVLKRLRWSEAVVAAGEPLLELGDPRSIEIVSDMLSSDAVQVSPGDPVHVEEWGGPHPLAGRVRRVEPSGFTKISALGVEEQRVNVIVDLEGSDAAAAELGDAYRVELRVVVWRGDDVLKLPVSSLFRDGEGWSVFAVQGGRARARRVEIGHRNGLEAEVLSGVEAGESVVLHPTDAVADGVRVVPRS